MKTKPTHGPSRGYANARFSGGAPQHPHTFSKHAGAKKKKKKNKKHRNSP